MLSALEVLYMHFIEGKTEDDIQQYDFWQDHYGVPPETLFNALWNQHVITETSELSVTLTKLTVVQLKHILRTHGLKVSGNKPVLINRIIAHSDIIDFTHLNLKNVYIVTDEYASLFHSTSFINYFHFNSHISITDAYTYYLKHPSLIPDAVITGILKQSVHEGMKTRNKYAAVKSHLLLSNYYKDVLKDSGNYVYHLNCFTMLITIEYFRRCREDRVIPDALVIDHYTIDRYRQLIQHYNIDQNTLYNKLVQDAKHLSDSTEAIQHAARAVILSVMTDRI